MSSYIGRIAARPAAAGAPPLREALEPWRPLFPRGAVPDVPALAGGVEVATFPGPAPCATAQVDGVTVVLLANPVFANGGRADAAAIARAWAERGAAVLEQLEGPFSLAVIDDRRRTCTLAVDRAGIQSAVWTETGDGLVFGTRADLVASLAGRRALDPQAQYDYLFFHAIPAPRTIFADVQRLSAGHCAEWRDGRMAVRAYWTPRYEESVRGSFPELRDEFRRRMRDAVAAEVAGVDGARVGAFLSGGTDSSTIAGMLSDVLGGAVDTFSIGFDASGFDETRYARCAAERFGTRHHEYYVAPGDLLPSIPELVAFFDQPFGNSSAFPTYWCAKLAHADGKTKLLGGDGGDELFAGNQRYAKMATFSGYGKIPAFARRGLVEPLIAVLPFKDRVLPLRKLASYVRQANIPLPDRVRQHELPTKIGAEAMLDPGFRARVRPEAPYEHLRALYHRTNARSEINRILAMDWQDTLADSDLRKVREGCALAGVDAGFPMLRPAIVDFAQRLHPDMKLKGTHLRWFFREALRGWLPDLILDKPKHGFGLPFGVLVTRNPAIQQVVNDALVASKRRGVLNPAFVDTLIGKLRGEADGDYAEFAWAVMIHERWLAHRGL